MLPDISSTTRKSGSIRFPEKPQKRTTQLQDQARIEADSLGFSYEADPYNVLVLNYTMKCPLACDFCCYGCTPKRQETMSLEFALDLVDQAADLGVFQQAGFTGGEPLLFFDEILEVCERLAKYRMGYSMISSCYWATDELETHRIVDPLIKTGLDVMSISYDPTHGKWVDPANVKRVVKAVAEQGVNVVVCASFYSASENLQSIFPELADNPQVELVNRLVLPTGRASLKDLTPSSYGIQVNSSAFACYKRIYNDFTVFWDGEVYPCCSVYNRSTEGLSIGNLYNSSLAEIWDRLEGSLMYRVMKRQGFAALYEIIQELDSDLYQSLPDPSKSIGPCELCHQIFQDYTITAKIRSCFEEYERRRIVNLLDRIKEVAGNKNAELFLEQVLS